MTWQPIATAPRDGTRVLLWAGGLATAGVFDRDEWITDYWGREYHQPTHWQPLPPAPSEAP